MTVTVHEGGLVFNAQRTRNVSSGVCLCVSPSQGGTVIGPLSNYFDPLFNHIKDPGMSLLIFIIER